MQNTIFTARFLLLKIQQNTRSPDQLEALPMTAPADDKNFPASGGRRACSCPVLCFRFTDFAMFRA